MIVLSGRAMASLMQLVIIIIVILFVGGLISWVVFDPTLTWDQRLIGAGFAIVAIAILLGVTVKCVFHGGRITIG